MREESGFAKGNVRRPPGVLLQGDNLKVVNMLELALELTGEATPSPSVREPGANPADYWKQKLAGWTRPGALALTGSAPVENTARPARLSLTLSVEVHDALRAFAEQVGVPFPVIFEAGWGLLLQRYSGEDDVLFGIVKSCVERGEGEREIAPHIVPSRLAFHDGLRVRPWIRQIADQDAAAAPFEFISLEQILAAAEIPPGTNLFDTVLSVGNDSFDPLSVVGGDSPRVHETTYPLAAAVYFGREISCCLAFAPERVSQQAAGLMLGHWAKLLQSMAAAPEELLSRLPMLTEAEQEQVLVTWNQTAAPYSTDACVHQLFERQVERTPDAVALEFQGKTLTYREVNYRANALAHQLRELGVGPDSIVAICLERSFDTLISVLAVLKAGGAYLPLDPAYPHERLQFMLEDSRAAVLLTHEPLRAIFPRPPQHVLTLEANHPTGKRFSRENPSSATNPENLAYLIYTSGSTGKPKGVAMIHRPLVNLIEWQIKDSRVRAGTKTLQFTSLSFDVSFQESFATLCCGGTLVLIPAALRLSPRDLWSFIVGENITRIFLPFVALQQLADAAAVEGNTAEGLREVITAGEQLQITPRVRELFARHRKATLHNHYGPSETHVVTALTLNGDPQHWPALPSIGRPIQNAEIFILDRQLAPVPVDIPGELYIGGAALARGYFERPEVTEQKFVPNPFTHEGSPRLYRTGDLARYLANGEIEFLGRIDHQVKIRGYRVELGEIEAALNRMPAVRECVVMAREQSPGLRQLVAYVVPETRAPANAPALREELKRHLPEYMIPPLFVFLEKLPLTPSGKVNRRALPEPDQVEATASAPAASGETPWLPIQLQLVQIWQEILNVQPIGIRDNFFDLGGHSLLAVKMMERVERLTGLKLPVTALFEGATIAHLTELILGGEQRAARPVIELQPHGDGTPVYFLHGDIIGGGFYARDLSNLLGNKHPFYVLPPFEVNDGDLPSVEEMAALHLKDLRAHRQGRRCVLGGFCIGALVAYEMAVRLKAAGEPPPWIALIDPQLASRPLRTHLAMVKRRGARRKQSPEQMIAAFARGYRLLYRLREEWQAPARAKLEFVMRKTSELLRLRRADVSEENAAVKDFADDREQQILSRFLWILSSYRPPFYDGAVTIFLTDEQKTETPFLERAWRKVAPSLEVRRIPGAHLGAITTDVHVLADGLRAGLERL